MSKALSDRIYSERVGFDCTKHKILHISKILTLAYTAVNAPENKNSYKTSSMNKILIKSKLKSQNKFRKTDTT